MKIDLVMINVLGKIKKLPHLAKDNNHYSLINFHFSCEFETGGERADPQVALEAILRASRRIPISIPRKTT